MNQFTRDFLRNDFPKIEYQFETDASDLRHSSIPAIEVPINQSAQIHRIYNRCLQLKNRFSDISTGQFFNHWYTRPRSQGWKELCVLYKQVGMRDTVDPTKIHYRENLFPANDMELEQLCTDLFKAAGISVEQITILKLEPNGWINPHKDNVDIPVGLGYFWMPLHEFDPVLKVFPYGWLNHQLGNLYLFNHCRYVHAVCNDMEHDRLVMIGRLDLSNPGEIVRQCQKLSGNTWKKLWGPRA